MILAHSYAAEGTTWTLAAFGEVIAWRA